MSLAHDDHRPGMGAGAHLRRTGGKRPYAAGGGFTLIEILVALVVVAVALSAIVAETGNYVSNAAHMGERTLAHWVAMNKVAEQHVTEEWPSPGESDGTALMADREWFWTMNVAETADEDVRRIDVEVRASRDAGRPAATAIAYVGRGNR